MFSLLTLEFYNMQNVFSIDTSTLHMHITHHTTRSTCTAHQAAQHTTRCRHYIPFQQGHQMLQRMWTSSFPLLQRSWAFQHAVCDFFLKKNQGTLNSSLPLLQRSSAFQHAVFFLNQCTWTLSLPLLQRSAAFQRAVCLCVYVCVCAHTCRRGTKESFFVPKRNKQRTHASVRIRCLFACVCLRVNIVRNIEQGRSIENKRKKEERCWKKNLTWIFERSSTARPCARRSTGSTLSRIYCMDKQGSVCSYVAYTHTHTHTQTNTHTHTHTHTHTYIHMYMYMYIYIIQYVWW